MIELRMKVYGHGSETLQYRYVKSGAYNGGGETGVYACAPHCWEWSKWQDVPRVDWMNTQPEPQAGQE